MTKKVSFKKYLDILKISGKILQKSKFIMRDRLIELFDKIYSIISKYRNNFKSLEDLELIEKEKSILF
jgi:Holliday junction resolvasome RuvABC endonuclease subunit